MQNIVKVLFILLLFLSTTLMAQVAGDYRTRDSGDWSNAQIWERYNGSSWAAIGTPKPFASGKSGSNYVDDSGK